MGKKVNASGSPPGSGECIKLPSWEGWGVGLKKLKKNLVILK
jgi:hypothetical protein